jgi:hypothetical protein
MSLEQRARKSEHNHKRIKRTGQETMPSCMTIQAHTHTLTTLDVQ